MPIKLPTRLMILMLLLLLPPTIWAENSTSIPGYKIHHNAIPTASLTPEIASSYRITRSKYRGLLNVSIIKEIPGTTGQPVTAQVSADAKNLIGQRREISLREIREGEAVYYIGDFPIVDAEILIFDIRVTLPGMENPAQARLSQQFFID